MLRAFGFFFSFLKKTGIQASSTQSALCFLRLSFLPLPRWSLDTYLSLKGLLHATWDHDSHQQTRVTRGTICPTIGLLLVRPLHFASSSSFTPSFCLFPTFPHSPSSFFLLSAIFFPIEQSEAFLFRAEA